MDPLTVKKRILGSGEAGRCPLSLAAHTGGAGVRAAAGGLNLVCVWPAPRVNSPALPTPNTAVTIRGDANLQFACP